MKNESNTPNYPSMSLEECWEYGPKGPVWPVTNTDIYNGNMLNGIKYKEVCTKHTPSYTEGNKNYRAYALH